MHGNGSDPSTTVPPVPPTVPPSRQQRLADRASGVNSRPASAVARHRRSGDPRPPAYADGM